jgi:hypothetical protein
MSWATDTGSGARNPVIFWNRNYIRERLRRGLYSKAKTTAFSGQILGLLLWDVLASCGCTVEKYR